jgi:hypothetical protein
MKGEIDGRYLQISIVYSGDVQQLGCLCKNN